MKTIPERLLRARVVVVFLVLLAGALASACSMPTKVRSMFGGDIPFTVSVAPDANENSAIAVDLIVVYDKKLADELLKLPAAEWFKGKEQFLSDHRDLVEVKEWEWTPAQTVPPQSIAYRAGARKVVIFADYATEGHHRAAVDPQQPFRLVLDRLDLDVKEQE